MGVGLFGLLVSCLPIYTIYITILYLVFDSDYKSTLLNLLEHGHGNISSAKC